MGRNQEILVSLGISILATLAVAPTVFAQAAPGAKTGVPTDWSSHHVIFSQPATAKKAERVQQDPRYWQQHYRQSAAKLPQVETLNVLDSGWQFGLDADPGGHTPKGDWAEDMGSGASVGADNYPAKYSFSLTTANCAGALQPDFTVYGTGLAGTLTQASIVAYDNLYSGCSGTVPTVYWAYNTANGKVTTSPVFSQDGTQIAFVQTNVSTGNGLLVLLKWAASTTDSITNPTSLTRVANSDYPTCVAPCMTTTRLEDTLGNRHADTNSSAFYDYPGDTIYIGDDAGWLHQITPVFKGAPTEVTSGGWPVQVNPGSLTPALTSPVFDSTSGIVFVADAGGFLYRVGPGTASVATSGQLDFSEALDGGPGIVEGPFVDSVNELVYVFAPSDGSASCTGGADCSAVFELAVDFPEGNLGAESVVGSSTVSGSGTPSPLYLGGFDSAYRNSVNGTGNLYVCGNTGGAPTLYQVPITAGAMNFFATAGPVLSTSTTPCSPVTDVSGGAAEFIFASVQDGGVPSGCASGGCILNFKNTPWQPLTSYALGQEVLDTHFQIQAVAVAGTSGAHAPSWSGITSHTTTDGTVTWIDQGVASATTFPPWIATHAYLLHQKILDGNNNIQVATKAGTSGGTVPTFNTTPGGTTTDGTGGTAVTWTNLGALATAHMPAAGGTSGVVIDNNVGSGTLAGASQVYFSTLSDQACGTSGTGGCAVQSSQSGLH
jgi:hypothetical protein